ncbi:MAG: DUF4123 domain-containing protein [Burkholderiales bacterium]|nr:DUF4123 domain-containing protein [Burkholderiales bacterium]
MQKLPTQPMWESSLRDWASHVAGEIRIFALVDLANLHEQRLAALQVLMNCGAQNILRDARPDAQEAGVWLAELPTLPHRGFSITLDQSIAWAKQSACVTWLKSDLPPDALSERLHQRTFAELPDHYAVLLRFFDPRVLPELKTALNAEQARSWWTLGHSWAYVSRARQFETISLFQSVQDSFNAPLHLSQQQFDQMLAASEVDQVMPELVREVPNQFLSLDPVQRVPFTRAWLNQANELNLTSFADRVLLTVLALKLGIDFLTQPQWQALLDPIKEGKITLLQAVKQATR